VVIAIDKASGLHEVRSRLGRKGLVQFMREGRCHLSHGGKPCCMVQFALKRVTAAFHRDPV